MAASLAPFSQLISFACYIFAAEITEKSINRTKVWRSLQLYNRRYSKDCV